MRNAIDITCNQQATDTTGKLYKQDIEPATTKSRWLPVGSPGALLDDVSTCLRKRDIEKPTLARNMSRLW